MTATPTPITYARTAGWNERLAGLVGPDITERQVMIVGCGSVGSFVADELCRVGVSRFTLADGDRVESANLSRTVYRHDDLGSPKTDALARHLTGIYPDVSVQSHPCRLQDLGADLRPALSGVDLVIGAVDDPRASGLVDRWCCALGIPALHVGLYRGAKGGEIVAVHPRWTPCLACATGGVREALRDVSDLGGVVRPRDYGTGRLRGEIALGCDIHFVSAAAVKIGLALLSLEDDESRLAGFVRGRLESREHYVMFGMEPDYFIFPRTHEQALGQHAFQSIWLQTSSRPECPRCGDPAGREAPFAAG